MAWYLSTGTTLPLPNLFLLRHLESRY